MPRLTPILLQTLRPVALTALAAAAFGAPSQASARSSEKPMNIVVILIDDMGWRDTEPYGSRYYHTPNISRLASESVRFTDAYAPASVCSPSRAAILTGKSPARLHITDWIPGGKSPAGSRFHVPDWNLQLPLEEVTLAEVLKRRGYATASIGKWHLGGESHGKSFLPDAQGFDVSIAGGHMEKPGSYFWPYGKPGDKLRVPHLAESGGAKGEYLTDRLTDEALGFIEKNKGKPFFLYLPHYAVHLPLAAKAADIEAQADTPVVDGQNNKTYAAMVKSVDDSVGRILGRIKSLGLEDDTAVVFTSDNGGQVSLSGPTSNLPLREGKGFPYEGGLRVPFIVKIPGVTKPGVVSRVPVIGTDLFPTLAAIAGAPAPGGVRDGINLLPALRGETPARDTLCWHYPHYWLTTVTPYSVIRHGDWKLVRWYETGVDELYNLKDDPSEKTDLAASREAVRKDLSSRLDAWLKETGAQAPVPRDGWKAPAGRKPVGGVYR